jgi:hypothetical protein
MEADFLAQRRRNIHADFLALASKFFRGLGKPIITVS